MILGCDGLLRLGQRFVKWDERGPLPLYLTAAVVVWASLGIGKDPVSLVVSLLTLSLVEWTFPTGVRLLLTLLPLLIVVGLGTRVLLRQSESQRLLRSWGAWPALLLVSLWLIAGFPGLGGFARTSVAQAKVTQPNIPPEMWQALTWLKQNAPRDAVVAAWWDYGYWIQSVGDRASILDNSIEYPAWIHRAARHLFCAQSELEALSWLKTHQATHVLLTARDLGLLEVISEIGSNEGDRRCKWNAANPSPEARRTFLARRVALNGPSTAFRLVYPTDGFKPLTSGGSCCGGGGTGTPVAIWEIHYPDGTQANLAYLRETW